MARVGRAKVLRVHMPLLNSRLVCQRKEEGYMCLACLATLPAREATVRCLLPRNWCVLALGLLKTDAGTRRIHAQGVVEFFIAAHASPAVAFHLNCPKEYSAAKI